MRITVALATVGAVLLVGCSAASLNGRPGSGDPSRLQSTRVYCTADNESHFDDVNVELSTTNFAPPAAPIYVGGRQPAAHTLFIAANPRWGAQDRMNGIYHPTPAAQFVVVLAGAWSITTTDSETRVFVPGDVVRLDDTTPCKGHIAVVGDRTGRLMFAS